MSDHFAIVTFESGLATPVHPSSPLQYADADVPFTAPFSVAVNGLSVISGDNTPANIPITDASATLGRVLCFDPRLSANDRTSCRSCHHPALGYSDALQFCVGFAGALICAQCSTIMAHSSKPCDRATSVHNGS